MDANQQFEQHTNTFLLNASLSECSLRIKLHDFSDWVIYERDYTQADIGKDINRKVDLSDLVLSLKQTKESDQYKMRQKQRPLPHLKCYDFGTVCKFGEMPCYKIDKGGLLTIYVSMMQRKTNKEINCESVLQLNKVREMSEEQIAKQKAIKQKGIKEQQAIKTQQKMEAILRDNSYLREQTQVLKSQVKHLNDELVITKVQLMKTNEKYASLSAQIEKQRHKNSQQIVELIKRVELLEQINKKHSSLLQQKQMMKVDYAIEKELMGLPQLNSNCFKINGNKMEFTGQNGSWTQFIINKTIPYGSLYVFKIKIVRSPQRGLFIGIVDYEKQRDKKNSQNSGNSVCYYSYGGNGQKYPPQTNEGSGYSQGEVVEVRVELEKKLVSWIVNGKQRASHTHEILSDKSRVFMPFVQVSYVQDVLEWIPV